MELRPDRGDLYKPVNTAFFGAGGGDLLSGVPADTGAVTSKPV